jgi:hypothetical protein
MAAIGGTVDRLVSTGAGSSRVTLFETFSTTITPTGVQLIGYKPDFQDSKLIDFTQVEK